MSEPDAKTDAKNTARSVEAILLSSGRPVAPQTLASATKTSTPKVEEALRTLSEKYSPEGSGVVLERVAGGYRLATNRECQSAVETFRKDARPSPLSGAAYEVLSCVLYLGPATRAQISKVRGVNSDAVIRNLLERNLLVETRSPNAAGSPAGSPNVLDLSEDFFIASETGSRKDFPPLESLVSEGELARVREKVLRADDPAGEEV